MLHGRRVQDVMGSEKALVAYLHELGTMVDVNATAAQEALKQERGR